MHFCEKFPEIIERFDRYWAGADTDRPLLFLTTPSEDPDTTVGRPEIANPADRILPENMVAQARAQLAHTAYIAEGFPHFFVNFGPGALHACIGGDADFGSPDTTWFPRFLSDIEEFTTLRFQPEGKWWPRSMAATDALLDELGGELVVSFTDIGGAADIVGSAVGRESLLIAAVERPELVKKAVDHCHTLWMEAYEANYAAFAGRQDVTTPWWPVVSRGRTYMTQCDANALVSPKVFSDLFADELGAIFKALDNAAYHLDGIGTESQVPALLAQESLQCVQWVPAPGATALRHERMLREIQEAGVSVTFALTPEEVEQACKKFDPRRLFLNVSCESEAQARELVENTLRWCE